MTIAIDWPMILRTAGEAELGLVRTEDEWEIDPSLHARRYQPEDRLIDAAGVEYRLEFRTVSGRGRNEIVATGRRYQAEEVVSLAERHVETVGARTEWLHGHLAGIADEQRIRAVMLYLAKLAAADVDQGSEGGEDYE
jgi:hypothetical protein